MENSASFYEGVNRDFELIDLFLVYSDARQLDFDTLGDRLPSSIEDIILANDLSAAYQMHTQMEYEFYPYLNVGMQSFLDNFDLGYWIDLITAFGHDIFISLLTNLPSLSIRDFDLFGIADR